MLTLRFPMGLGETPICSRALCFRFCADGTLRSGDNAVAARRGVGGWRIGHGLYPELECAGPVIMTARARQTRNSARHGPFGLVRTEAGLLIADDASLGIYLPTWEGPGTMAWHEIVLVPAPMPA
jgi:hypothetical protein